MYILSISFPKNCLFGQLMLTYVYKLIYIKKDPERIQSLFLYVCYPNYLAYNTALAASEFGRIV